MGQSKKLNKQPNSLSPLVQLAGIRKCFDGKEVIPQLDLTINNGEFLTLLGPSGCGKTTVLRLIAGLETVDSGRIMLDNEDITHVPAENRYVNTVFQSYALFPHMTVFENVAFGLRMQKTPAAEITPRVMEALRMVQLETFAQRKPHQLSGGQQQRVAIARAVVNKPRLLLLDESLSALDYKLRKQMQNELKALMEGEVNLGMIWNGSAFVARQAGTPIDVVWPKEGGIFWMDSLAIPANAKNKEGALKLINFLLRPDVAKQVAETIGYPTPNLAARKLLSPEVANDKTLYPDAETIKNGEWQNDVGSASSIYEEYYQKLKAGR